MTISEKILLSAAELESRANGPFSAEELVVEAWKKYPDSFALQGYPEFPDSNRIYSEIMGSKPLRKRGLLVKVGEKRYQLSDAGRIAAESLRGMGGGTEAARAHLNRREKALLERLFSSKAVQKAASDMIDSIIFPDACEFWDISSHSHAQSLQVRLHNVEAVLDLAERLVGERGALTLRHGGLSIRSSDLQLLRDTHMLLLEMFAGDLKFILDRKDERRRY